MKRSKQVLDRRQFVFGAGALIGTSMLGCDGSNRQTENTAVEGSVGSTVTIFENGVILPVDEAFSEHEAFAIADNRVLAVGSREAVRAAAGRVNKVVDLGGRVILPGFIEPHMHFAMLAGSRPLARHWSL